MRTVRTMRGKHRRRAALAALLTAILAATLLAACAPGRARQQEALREEPPQSLAADVGTDQGRDLGQDGAEAADGAGATDGAGAADGATAGAGKSQHGSADGVAQPDGEAAPDPSDAVRRQRNAQSQRQPKANAAPAGPGAITGGKLLLPPGYDRRRSYPLLVVLPYTGGSAQNLLEYYLFSEYNPRLSLQAKWERSLRAYYPNNKLLQQRAYFILVPDGKGSARDHNYRGFARAIERYEQRILLGIREAVKEYAIDPRRIILAGHSLGGDLSWALTLRNPTTFAGALISGSRTGYWEDDRLPILAKRKFRYFFAMGTAEARVRLNGLKRSLAKLKHRGVAYRFWRTPKVGHQPPRKHALAQALDYVFFGPQPENEGTRPQPRVARKANGNARPKATAKRTSKRSSAERTAAASK